MSTTAQLGAPASKSENAPAGAPSVPLIELNGLTVRFGNREILHGLTAALRGRAIGLLGPNGAGKSTLLRLLSGIYEPTVGISRIVGKVAPVFDLGVGMDPEISGYENIIIRGLFLGMTRKQMENRTEEIAEFSELGDYLSMPLRTY